VTASFAVDHKAISHSKPITKLRGARKLLCDTVSDTKGLEASLRLTQIHQEKIFPTVRIT